MHPRQPHGINCNQLKTFRRCRLVAQLMHLPCNKSNLTKNCMIQLTCIHTMAETWRQGKMSGGEEVIEQRRQFLISAVVCACVWIFFFVWYLETLINGFNATSARSLSSWLVVSYGPGKLPFENYITLCQRTHNRNECIATHTHTHSLIRHRTYQWRNIMFYKVVSCTTDAFSDAASGEMTYFAVHLSQSGVENGFSCWREQNTFQFVETNNVGSTLLFGHHMNCIYDFKFNWKQSQWIPLTNNATLHPSLLSTHFFAQPTKVLCTRFDRENGAKH